MSREQSRVVRHFVVLCLAFSYISITNALTTLQKQDPDPMFSALDPHDFLYLPERLNEKYPQDRRLKKERVGIAISAFGLNANRGTNYLGQQYLPQTPGSSASGSLNPCTVIPLQCGIPIELGDIAGRINTIALLDGVIPAGKVLPPVLQAAMNQLYPGMTPPINDPTLIDPNQMFGCISVPLKFRKRGIRLDISANLIGDFGINFQTSVASMTQTPTAYNDLTCTAIPVCPFTVNSNTSGLVQTYLTGQFANIVQQLGVDAGTFNATSVEEMRFNLYWRHAYELNAGNKEWPHFLLMPFVVLSASASPGKKMHPSQLYAVAFGNNDHPSVGFDAGLSFDFIDTIEIAAEFGITHFFSRNVCNLRIPNSKYQRTLFPFTANARVSPGYNWNFGLKIGAYHFLDNLSLYFEYIMVNHTPDKICLQQPDPAFLPGVLEAVSPWKRKLANIAFTYDLSPNITAGFLWQAPLSQRNAYASSTIMLTFDVVF